MPQKREFIIPRPTATNGPTEQKRTEYIGVVVPPTPAYTTHRLWHTAYHKEIFDLYQIYKDRITEYYPKKDIDWCDIKLYNDFSRMLYECSSKYIVE